MSEPVPAPEVPSIPFADFCDVMSSLVEISALLLVAETKQEVRMCAEMYARLRTANPEVFRFAADWTAWRERELALLDRVNWEFGSAPTGESERCSPPSQAEILEAVETCSPAVRRYAEKWLLNRPRSGDTAGRSDAPPAEGS